MREKTYCCLCPSINPLLQVKLVHLALGWNKIDGASATVLFKALSNHQRILSLDVSWNSIGTFPTPHPASTDGMNALCHFVKQTETLFHLNLSANKFSFDDCNSLQDSLTFNESICGLHFDKNTHGKMDSKGFLAPMNVEFQEAHLAKGQSHGYGRQRASTAGEQLKLARDTMISSGGYTGSMCWACGQWVEVEFEYIAQK